MRLELPATRKRRLVSMTPLIDVVFILLLFFMLASNFQQWRSMPLNLAGQTEKPNELEPNFNVNIGQDGELTLEDSPVELENLTQMLLERVAGGANPRILIKTDAATELQTLVHVIDRISAAGISQITLGGIKP
ncbi:MAG: biopolymer transporter ExbD [Gammaproteobacteria bacterium]|nr:biopolymer transporter ExbD [Gammaproteobacteria bacterium]